MFTAAIEASDTVMAERLRWRSYRPRGLRGPNGQIALPRAGGVTGADDATALSLLPTVTATTRKRGGARIPIAQVREVQCKPDTILINDQFVVTKNTSSVIYSRQYHSRGHSIHRRLARIPWVCSNDRISLAKEETTQICSRASGGSRDAAHIRGSSCGPRRRSQ